MAEEKKKSVFETLNAINVNGHTQKNGNGLNYLSWSYAVQELSKAYPDYDFEVERFGESQVPYQYDPKLGYMVYTKITIEGKTREMWMPVMNSLNKAMFDHPYTYNTNAGKQRTVEAATMFDINYAIMRCLVKNIAMFGLGINLYQKLDEYAEGYIDSQLKKAQEEIVSATSDDAVVVLWNSYPELQKNETFKAAIGKRRGELAKLNAKK